MADGLGSKTSQPLSASSRAGELWALHLARLLGDPAQRGITRWLGLGLVRRPAGLFWDAEDEVGWKSLFLHGARGPLLSFWLLGQPQW